MIRIVIILALLLPLSIVAADSHGGGGSSGNGGGSADNSQGGPAPTLYSEQERENEQEQKGDDEPGQTDVKEKEQEREQEKKHILVGSSTELKVMVQTRKEEQKRVEDGVGEKEREQIQNENRINLATEVIESAQNLFGPRNLEVQVLVGEFKKTHEDSTEYEERFAKQSAFSRFLFGGDRDAAEEMEKTVAQNQVRVEMMNQMMQECDCDEEAKKILQEQLQNMEQEQARLKEVALKEKSKRGVFGFLFGWLKD
jgi:hypothetical protein